MCRDNHVQNVCNATGILPHTPYSNIRLDAAKQGLMLQAKLTDDAAFLAKLP